MLHPSADAELISAILRAAGIQQTPIVPADPGSPSDGLEKHLHTQIDQHRERLNSGKPRTAFELLEMLSSLPATASNVVRFRIKANIGHCLMRLDRNAEAAAMLFEAVDHDPTNPKAAANKVLAYILREDFTAAASEARAGLSRNPDDVAVAANLIQAASHVPEMPNPISELSAILQASADVKIADIVSPAIDTTGRGSPKRKRPANIILAFPRWQPSVPRPISHQCPRPALIRRAELFLVMSRRHWIRRPICSSVNSKPFGAASTPTVRKPAV